MPHFDGASFILMNKIKIYVKPYTRRGRNVGGHYRYHHFDRGAIRDIRPVLVNKTVSIRGLGGRFKGRKWIQSGDGTGLKIDRFGRIVGRSQKS